MTHMSDDFIERLRRLSTASISAALSKAGVTNCWVRGAAPLSPGQARIAGPAATLRFIPSRQDIAKAPPAIFAHTSRTAIEAMPSGAVLVVDSGGIADAGIMGDVLCARLHHRAIAGVVTDGAVRDADGIRTVGIGVWAVAVAAPLPQERLIIADAEVPIGCGGVAVLPGDLVVADSDGAVIIPAAMARGVAEAAGETEAFDSWVLGEIRRGVPLQGLYPPDPATLSRYHSRDR
jgi:regulator of RNase E activity RraA